MWKRIFGGIGSVDIALLRGQLSAFPGHIDSRCCRLKTTLIAVGLCLVLLLCTVPAYPQQTLTSNITARAQDATGAVIPGVEVTITSPAMIGAGRKEVTDETGSYRFTLVPPGTYRVSFALAGFKTLNIDGNTVTAGNTITVVGSLEVATTAEEVTVNSQAPTVDLEEATVGVNISTKMMDELPWSRSLVGVSMMTPGVYSTSFDIGNSAFGTTSIITATNGGVNNGNNVVTVDGLIWCQSYMDYGSFEEMNVSLTAKGADQMNSGITLNTVVKSGGNNFHGNVSAKYQNGSMQSNNVSPALLAEGYSVGSNKYTHTTDYFGDIGGPILKDKLWFYTAERWAYSGQFRPGFVTAVGGNPTPFYTELKSITTKFTYQLTQSQKLEAYMGLPDKYQPYRNGSALNPQDATEDQNSWSSQGPMLTYTNILNPKTSLSAKITRGGYWWPAYTYGFNGAAAGLGPNVAQLINGQLQMVPLPKMTWVGVQNVGIHVKDNTTKAVDGAYNSFYLRPIRWQETVDFSRFANVAQKNNEIKVGYTGWWDKDWESYPGYPLDESYTYKSLQTETCPNSQSCSNFFMHPYRVTVYDTPNKYSLAGGGSGLYQAFYFNDKISWNRKLTLNVGVRYDWQKSYLQPQGNTGEGPYATQFLIKDKIDYYPNPDGTKAYFPVYKLWSPRLSFAYDVKGNGRFAIKGSYGRYVGMNSGPGASPGVGGQDPVNPTSCTYAWDGSIPYKPNFGTQNYLGSPTNVGLLGSCANLSVVNGVAKPIASYQWDPGLKPSYITEYTATAEIALSHDYSIRVNVQRKFDHNNYKAINLNLPASAYTAQTCATDPGPDGRTGTSQFCYYGVPASDPRLNAPSSDYFVPTDESHHEGDFNYTAYVFTFNKNFSNRWQYIVSYGVEMYHQNTYNALTTVNGIQYGSYDGFSDSWYSNTGTAPNNIPIPAALGPNAFNQNAVIAAAPVFWNQSLKMNGIYALPGIPLFHNFQLNGLQYSATITTQNGQWYSRSSDIDDVNGSTQSMLMQNQFGRYPRLTDWDNEIRKKFKLGEKGGSLEFVWDLFNTMNSATVTNWASTDTASSLFLQPNNITPLRPSTILPPRIQEWSVTWRY